MKIRIFTLVLFLAVASIAFGQQKQNSKAPKTAEERAVMVTNGLNKNLNLSAEQYTQAKSINLEAAKSIDALQAKRKSGAITPEQAKTERQAIEKKRRSEIEAILTPEQKAKAEERKQKRGNQK